jgi:hypothetical protein
VPGWEIDLGRPGASARAEFERRRRRDRSRRRRMFGPLAAVIEVLAGPKRTTAVWARGSVGEVAVGDYLSRAVGGTGLVLHDRRIRGRRANIDHIAVVPSGVWVIDTKRHRGRVERRVRGRWLSRHPTLFVNGRDRSSQVVAACRQGELVRAVVGTDHPVHVALCFTGADWGICRRPFAIDGVVVIRPRRLAASLRRAGPLGGAGRQALAARLADAFPAYAPSGTSHRPTGPPPRG